MRVRWRGMELPSRVVPVPETLTDTYGMFKIEPFERGFGRTIGNSLRRILLSSLEGSAVTTVHIKGADHEFTSIAGVVEDVTDLVLNIKQIVVKTHTDEQKTITIRASKKGPVAAGDIRTDPTVEIVNPELHIVTLSDNVPFEVDMTVRRGRGYVTAEENTPEERTIGLIPVDSTFSPVLRVNYACENTRVGQRTNYDRLLLEIWTNGTIGPEMALVEASKIMRKHLNPFVHYFEIGRELQEEQLAEEPEPSEADDVLAEKLNMEIAQLQLSVRASNCLESEDIVTIGQLVMMSESELLKVRNFGKTSLREVKTKLGEMGLSLGMDPELVRSKMRD
ncbi:MAG: DNA-directed RNA polymerase subunit alpha [Planctomycetes bacterium DG_58]|nr:MAG: DNA-directed RNA polymerase subunit alpha [Planctomycetes bacterium DG_58]KPL02897.1 MAG: DNA-directed RNA polymerase subunit alpha [Planctomycetes bacterium SM23_65]